MARGVNKVILIGNLASDPDFKVIPNTQNPVATCSLATNESFRDQSGQIIERVEFHRLSFWGRTAEVMRDYARKGSQIYVEGKLRTRNWDDKNGVKHYMTEIQVLEMQLLGPSRSNQNQQPAPAYNNYQNQNQNSNNNFEPNNFANYSNNLNGSGYHGQPNNYPNRNAQVYGQGNNSQNLAGNANITPDWSRSSSGQQVSNQPSQNSMNNMMNTQSQQNVQQPVINQASQPTQQYSGNGMLSPDDFKNQNFNNNEKMKELAQISNEEKSVPFVTDDVPF